MPHPSMSHIVIVGAGFVGLSTARELKKLLRSDATVTLLDAQDHFLFTPLLIDALGSPDYPNSSLCAELKTIAKRDGFTFIHGCVTAVDRVEQTLSYTASTAQNRVETLAYDVLVLCQGVRPCFYGIPGAQEYALPLKSAADVHRIHARVERQLKAAAQTTNDNERQQLLAFVAVGAGASGVEAICALKQMVETHCVQNYAVLKTHLSWTLLQAAPEILPDFPPRLIQRTHMLLAAQGITVCTGATVTAVHKTQVTTVQTAFAAGCILWTAGIEPNCITMTPDLQTDRAGYLPIDAQLAIAPNIFGAGDVVTYREGNMPIPKNAQTALRMASVLAKNVVRQLKHQPLLTFRYVSRGNILILGKTGFFDFKFLVFNTRFTVLIRRAFYRWRFWQVTGIRDVS